MTIKKDDKIVETFGLNDPHYKLQCAPKPGNEKQKKYTCYGDDDLIEIREIWNQRHPEKERRIDETHPRKIWEALKKAMHYSCKRESCWLKNLMIDKNPKYKEMINYTFRPEKPKEWEKKGKETNTWLSSVDINIVMKQYEHVVPDFEFIGPSPIDFDKILHDKECVWDELCHFSIEEQIHRKKNKIGIVFNLDTHDEGGSHWVSLFINIKRGFLLFFDSVGSYPVPEIVRFIERVLEQCKKGGIPMKVYINNVRHQTSNTECGMYSLFMIIQMMNEEIKPEDFMKDRISDHVMKQMRDRLFSTDA